MSDLNDLNKPTPTDTEPNVLDTLRAHIIRAATWSGWGSTANQVAGIMSAVTTAVSGGRSLRLYRRSDANTSDEEIVSLPGVSIGGNAATASEVPWSGVGSKPSTRDGYGITDVPKRDGTGAAGTWGISIEGNAATVTNAFPAGTRMPFAQASAPTGWTQNTGDTANNRMLRVVNTAGGGVGGTHSPILNNVVPSHTHVFTTSPVSNDHAHYVSGSTSGGGYHNHSINRGANTNGGGYNVHVANAAYDGGGYTNGAGDHAHTWGNWTGGINSNHTHSGGTDNGSSQTNWQPRYIDMIICTKN